MKRKSNEIDAEATLRPPLLPAFFIDLAGAADSQRAGRDIVGDHAARTHVSPVGDLNRRNQSRVTADKRAVADYRRVLVPAVVVTRNRARADVGFLANDRIAEVSQVHRFRTR